MLGLVAALYDYDCTEAGRRFQLATACEPVSAQVRYYYGFYYLFTVGRYKEAVERQEQARKEDPLNLLSRVQLVPSLRAAGRYADALSELHKVRQLDENFWPLSFLLGIIHASQGNFAEAAPGPLKLQPCVIVFPRVLRLLEWRTTHEIDPAFQEGQRE